MAILKKYTQEVYVSFLSVGLVTACCLQTACLERILVYDKNGGAFVTFCQFASVVAIEAFSYGSIVWKERKIPLWVFLVVSAVMTFSSKSQNLALTLGIPLPVSTLYRSCTVALSVLTGKVFLGKTYSGGQMIGAAIVTLGIILVTFNDIHLNSKMGTSSDSHINEGKSYCENISLDCLKDRLTWLVSQESSSLESERIEWILGLVLISMGLLAGVLLGHFQEWVYESYKNKSTGEKPYKEFSLFLHIFTLPMMLSIDSETFKKQAYSWVWKYESGAGWRFPCYSGYCEISELTLLLFLCILFNFGCTRCAYALSAETSTVALNIVLTARKACTILLSMLIYGNTFQPAQWFGSALIFLGALMYSSTSRRTKEKTA